MTQRACYRSHVNIVVVFVLLCLTCRLAFSQHNTRSPADADMALPVSIVFVLGLAGSLNTDVRETVSTVFSSFDVTVIELPAQSLTESQLPDDAPVIAVGVAGCQNSVRIFTQRSILCALLTEENFRLIDQTRDAADKRNVRALVIDQPVSRQAHVAQHVYPALSRFAVLSDTPPDSLEKGLYELSFTEYRENRSLAPQLKRAIATTDALIATPTAAVFNRSTLRTVLLTAYGYGKPVIGLSKAYVKAGALITAYSTPEQVLREIFENLSESSDEKTVQSRVRYPVYFSVVDNMNVARSLDLTKLFEFDESSTYLDGDFR